MWSSVVEVWALLGGFAGGQGESASVLVLGGVLESFNVVWLAFEIGWRILLEGRAAGNGAAQGACAWLEVPRRALGFVPRGRLHRQRLAELLALKRPKLALQSLRSERRLLSRRRLRLVLAFWRRPNVGGALALAPNRHAALSSLKIVCVAFVILSQMLWLSHSA